MNLSDTYLLWEGLAEDGVLMDVLVREVDRKTFSVHIFEYERPPHWVRVQDIHELGYIHVGECPEFFSGVRVIVGPWGDPGLVPDDALLPMLEAAEEVIGYTSRWASCSPSYRDHLMAVVSQYQSPPSGWQPFFKDGSISKNLEHYLRGIRNGGE